jgi:hypothetical protein
MISTQRHSDTCTIRLTDSAKLTEAVVHDFKEHENLTVIVNKSVKISMRWNGRVYEGRSAGLSFESDGPSVIRVQSGPRGL